MIIKINEIKAKIEQNFKGGDNSVSIKAFTDSDVRIMRLKVEKGSSIGYHTHETNSETMYILSGTAKVIYDGEAMTVNAGEAHYCPKGHSHSVRNDNDEPLEIFAIVAER